MAQPAWVVRARRAQVRRLLIATQRLERRQARRAILAAAFAWLRYISQSLYPGQRRRMAAARAAVAARAILENVALEPGTPAIPSVLPPARAWADRLHR